MIYRLLCIIFSISVILIPNTKSIPTFYGKDAYDKSGETKELEPAEVQNAMCNIVTDQIKATANATITRQLKGVCHAREVREQLRHVETTIMRELHKIQKIVHTISAYQTSRKPVVFKYLPNRP